MFNKKYVYWTIAPVALAIALWSWWSKTDETGAGKPVMSQSPPSAQTNARAPSLATTNAQSTVTALPNLDPFATLALSAKFPLRSAGESSIAALRRLKDGRTLAEAKLAAAQSDDPVVWFNSLYMMSPCINEAVSLVDRDPRDYVASFSVHPKTRNPVPYAEEEVAFVALRANAGPARIHPPESLRAQIKEELERPFVPIPRDEEKPKRDFEREMQQWRELRAPLDANEKAAFDKTRFSLAAECKGEKIRGAATEAFRASREKLASEGVLGALIFNEAAGWTSKRDMHALSERDYALVERGIREQAPDALASMLLRMSIRGDLNVANLPDDAYLAWMGFGYESARLAACQFGAADCGPSGWIFQEACLMYGGCDQADVAALWRYVLARDGLPPDAMDRVVADLVGKIRRGDLEALGIRRKK